MQVLKSNIRTDSEEFKQNEKNFLALGGVVEALKFHLKGAIPLTESAPTRS